MNFRPLFRALHSADVLIIAFAVLLSVLNILFAARIPNWWIMVLINTGAILFIFAIAFARERLGWNILVLVHDWYVAPLVFFTFKELYFMIQPIHGGRDYDSVLIAIDRWLFGVNPTEWLTQFTHPMLTELLQIAYTLFYFLFLLVGYELYRNHPRGEFHYFMFTCVYGFYLSYLGYFTFPAVGPRFTLHDFAALDADLPGVLLTPYLRWFVNAGESVAMGASNAVAMASAQRDVFPSGHTMMTLVLMHFSLRFRLSTRYFTVTTGILLVLATVYQRYHYVIDLVGGAAFMVFCVWSAPVLYRFFRDRLETMDRRYPWRPDT